MYSGLLLVAIAFFDYASAQAQCDACVKVSGDFNQTCAQYYQETDQAVIVDTKYYDCICSLTNEYNACAKCTYSAADYQTWSDDWTFMCDTYANLPETTYTLPYSPTDSYSLSAYPTESLTAPGDISGTLSPFSFSISLESIPGGSDTAVTSTTPLGGSLTTNVLTTESTPAAAAPSTNSAAASTISTLSSVSLTTAAQSSLITSKTSEGQRTPSTSALTTMVSSAAAIMKPSWSFAYGLLLFLWV
ncbi:hypothetical protein V1522DRAFT_411189 [Lipomyces starkeyi]